MATRKTAKRRLKKYAIGDMRERITLHERTITAPVFGSAAFTEAYDTGVTVWASASTLSLVSAGQALFDGVQMKDRPTDVFIIRYRDNVTTETIIRWQGNAYEIKEIINPDRRKQYIELRSRIIGDVNKEANT